MFLIAVTCLEEGWRTDRQMNRENHIEKDLKGTYLWVNREEVYGEKYEEFMLNKQMITGLIPFYETEIGGEAWLVYQLESRKAFVDCFSSGRMGCLQMETFIKSLIRVMETVDDYLLDPSNLVIEMSCIFEDGQSWEYIYIPGYKEDFWKQMEKISEEWLNYVDYGDERAVLWAYTFYERVHGHACSMDMIENILKLEKNTVPIYENIIQEESTIYEEPKLFNQGKKQSWWSRLKEKTELKWKFGRIWKEPEISDFFSKKSELADTCPSLNLPEFHEDENLKQFVLIPVGENESTMIRFSQMPAIIGRAKGEVDIWLEYPGISRIHARFEEKEKGAKVVDMDSANGTYRNGERLKPGELYDLYIGDILKLADLEFICQWC